jgi:hypothetical protein
MTNLELFAEHETGHAVMRWLCDMPATEVWISETEGRCLATSKRFPAVETLLVKLGGVAVETGFGLFGDVSWEPGGFDDLDKATAIIEGNIMLRQVVGANLVPSFVSTEVALQHWLRRAGSLLINHVEVIEAIARLLLSDRRILPRRLAGILQSYARRSGDPDLQDGMTRRLKSLLFECHPTT